MKHLAPELFDLVVSRTRMHARTRQAARAVLVDGLTSVAAGREHRMSQQHVSRAVAKVRRAVQQDFGCCPVCGTKMENRT